MWAGSGRGLSPSARPGSRGRPPELEDLLHFFRYLDVRFHRDFLHDQGHREREGARSAARRVGGFRDGGAVDRVTVGRGRGCTTSSGIWSSGRRYFVGMRCPLLDGKRTHSIRSSSRRTSLNQTLAICFSPACLRQRRATVDAGDDVRWAYRPVVDRENVPDVVPRPIYWQRRRPPGLQGAGPTWS